jgi:aryl-alcohol dehydrogenase-like predicted oxidoreductase
MKYRELGNSGETVSPMGLGGNVFGYYCDAVETRRIMDVALDSGINYVDTADVYSDGKSESLIGAAIGGRRDRWFIATKVGVTSDGTNHGIGSRKNILTKVEASLKRLGTNHIDLYQMHHFDPTTPIEETLSALSDLVTQGKIRYFGVSNYTGAELLESARLSLTTGTPTVSSVQNLYHLLKRDIERDLLPAIRETGASVIAYGVLARGILSNKYQQGVPPPSGSRAESSANVRSDLDPDVLTLVQSLHKFAQSSEKSSAQLAAAWALRLPEVCTILLGIRNEHQLQEILPGLSWTLTKEELTEVEEIVGDTSRFESLALGSQFRPA